AVPFSYPHSPLLSSPSNLLILPLQFLQNRLSRFSLLRIRSSFHRIPRSFERVFLLTCSDKKADDQLSELRPALAPNSLGQRSKRLRRHCRRNLTDGQLHQFIATRIGVRRKTENPTRCHGNRFDIVLAQDQRLVDRCLRF